MYIQKLDNSHPTSLPQKRQAKDPAAGHQASAARPKDPSGVSSGHRRGRVYVDPQQTMGKLWENYGKTMGKWWFNGI